MFFRKKKEKAVQTEEASEYKRGYNDGYSHGLSKTESNISAFSNNVNYIRGYEYGYRVGTQEAKFNEMQTKKLNKCENHFNMPSQNNINEKVNAQKEVNNNMFNNFSKNKNNACNFLVCMILYLGDSRLLRTFMPFN